MLDALELSSFYEEPMGQVTRRQIMRRIRLAWPDLRGLRVLGYGFAPPYLKACLPEAERALAFIPAQLGAVAWPADRRLVAVGEEGALPFPDAFFDRVLMVHGLESAEATRPLMRQIWRVLAESGRLIVVAPNRASLWAQVERSPFAHGRPFNRMQLETLLRESLFVPERWDTALYFPPIRSRRLVRSGIGWERIGRRLWPRLAGVHIVDSSKSMYALALNDKVTARKRVLAPAR
jgi:SAM-dependent methyltransferase